MRDNVLVTGGAGFIGSHVVDYLIKKYNVIIIDDLSGGFIENINKNAKFIKCNIEDYELILKIFYEYKFKYVFHLAAYAAEGLSHFIKRYNYNNNLVGSVNLINASIKYNVKCFVFTSSIAVYGENQLPMTEELIPQPEDSYGIAKLAVETELKASKKMFDLNYIIFRPHNVFGPRQNIGDKYRNVIGIFMNQIMQNLPLTVFGDGEQTRSFSYINDVAPIIAKSVENPKVYNNIFNIGADKPYSINELIKVISDVIGIKPKVNYFPRRNEVQHAYSSHEKIKRYFNKKHTTDIRTGIENMWNWAKIVGIKKSKDFKNIEIDKNLPEIWRSN